MKIDVDGDLLCKVNPNNVLEAVQLTILVKILDEIEAYGPFYKSEGLCQQVQGYFFKHRIHYDLFLSDVEDMLKGLVQDWAERRDLDHSVPIEGSGRNYTLNRHKWDKFSAFGKARWAMVKDVKAMAKQRLENLT